MTVHMKQFQAAHVEEPLNQSVNRESNDSFEGFLGDNERMLKEISANQEFVKRTESLIKKLEEKNRELEKYAILVESLEPIPGMDPRKYLDILAGNEDAPDIRDAKIVSLAKKCRNLTLSLGKEKTRVVNHQREIQLLTRKHEQLEHEYGLAKEAEGKLRIAEKDVPSDTESFRKLKRDLATTARQLEDMRRKYEQGQEEQNTLKRTLAREIGTGPGIDSESMVDKGWKGRAQQIVMLKSKVKNLENALASSREHVQVHGKNISGDSRLESQSMNTSTKMGRTSRAIDVDSKAHENLAEMSDARASAIEYVSADNDRLAQEKERLLKKCASQQARIGALESDVKRQKDDIKMMLSKSNTDEEFVEALRTEVTKAREQLKSQGKRLQAVSASRRIMGEAEAKTGGNQEILLENQRLQRLVRQQASQIQTQSDVIQQLRERVDY
jgi:hypothetical protein